MATLAQHLIDLINEVGEDVKANRVNIGTLTSLTTTDKTNLVAALNELKTAIDSAITINDLAGNGDTGVTWSADKIYDSIEAAKLAVKNDLLNGAASTLDTLNELAAAINNDANFSTTIATQIANRVRYDDVQTLTAGQKTQACTNIGIGDPDTDFVAVYNAAKA